MSDLYASADLGGTTIGLALGTATGEILAQTSLLTQSHEGPERVLERIAAALVAFAKTTGQQPRGLGMGVPGLLDFATGTTLFLPNLPTQWRNVPVKAVLERHLGYPVFLLNDARLAALGENALGWGRDGSARTMVFFTVGTGIGGGVVVDGRLRLGPLGAAGEIGHQTIVPNGPLCGCGNYGCLETLASGPAIAAEAIRLMRSGMTPALHARTGGDANLVSPATVAESAATDEPLRDLIRRTGEYLGIGAGNLVTALHPDLVVIGGGVSGMGELLLAPIRETVRRRVRMFPVDGVRIECSQLGDRAGTLGGLVLAARQGDLN
jgi:glucokinase